MPDGPGTCPECGTEHASETDLRLGRARPRLAAAVLLAGVGLAWASIYPLVRDYGWLRMLPPAAQHRVWWMETNWNGLQEYAAVLADPGVGVAERSGVVAAVLEKMRAEALRTNASSPLAEVAPHSHMLQRLGDARIRLGDEDIRDALRSDHHWAFMIALNAIAESSPPSAAVAAARRDIIAARIAARKSSVDLMRSVAQYPGPGDDPERLRLEAIASLLAEDSWVRSSAAAFLHESDADITVEVLRLLDGPIHRGTLNEVLSITMQPPHQDVSTLEPLKRFAEDPSRSPRQRLNAAMAYRQVSGFVGVPSLLDMTRGLVACYETEPEADVFEIADILGKSGGDGVLAVAERVVDDPANTRVLVLAGRVSGGSSFNDPVDAIVWSLRHYANDTSLGAEKRAMASELAARLRP